MFEEILHHGIIFVIGVVFGWSVKGFVKGQVKG